MRYRITSATLLSFATYAHDAHHTHTQGPRVSHSCVVGKMVMVMGSAAMKRDSEWKTEFGEHMTSELAERHKEPASRIQ